MCVKRARKHPPATSRGPNHTPAWRPKRQKLTTAKRGCAVAPTFAAERRRAASCQFTRRGQHEPSLHVSGAGRGGGGGGSHHCITASGLLEPVPAGPPTRPHLHVSHERTARHAVRRQRARQFADPLAGPQQGLNKSALWSLLTPEATRANDSMTLRCLLAACRTLAQLFWTFRFSQQDIRANPLR